MAEPLPAVDPAAGQTVAVFPAATAADVDRAAHVVAEPQGAAHQGWHRTVLARAPHVVRRSA